MQVVLLTLEGDMLRIVRIGQESGSRVSMYPRNIDSIIQLSQHTLILQEKDTNKLRSLHIEYKGNVQFKDKLVSKEHHMTILKLLGQKGTLYALLNQGKSYFLKIYKLTSSHELEMVSQIGNLEINHAQFLQGFLHSTVISASVLIHNDKTLTKIYEGKKGA